MEQLRAEEISSIIKKQIKDFDTKLEVNETGTIISIGDGVARVHGLDKCMAGEMIELPGNVYGVALNLEEGNVGVAIFGRDTGVKEGDTVKRTGKILQVPVKSKKKLEAHPMFPIQHDRDPEQDNENDDQE